MEPRLKRRPSRLEQNSPLYNARRLSSVNMKCI